MANAGIVFPINDPSSLPRNIPGGMLPEAHFVTETVGGKVWLVMRILITNLEVHTSTFNLDPNNKKIAYFPFKSVSALELNLSGLKNTLVQTSITPKLIASVSLSFDVEGGKIGGAGA